MIAIAAARSSKVHHRLAALILGALCLTLTSSLHAQDSDPSRVATATELFDEALRDMDSGRAREACPKLVRSQELAPSGGTLLALGDCWQRTGKITSAWVAFREAAARAAAAGKREAEQQALDRAEVLRPRLPRLTITAPTPRPPGLEVRRDNVVLTPTELGISTPVDPGPHEIRATTGTAKTWTTSVEIREGQTLTVKVPAEAPAANGTTPQPARDPKLVIGLTLAGVGVVTMGVGGVFGLLAKDANDEALTFCRGNVCQPRGLELTDDANRRALVSTVLFVAGSALAAGGAILFFTSHKPSATSLSVTPLLSVGGAGAAARVSF